MITHMQVNVKKLHENAVLPTYGSTNAAGADLYACIDAPLTIAPHETVMVHTGLAMEIPEGYAGLVYARSGLAAKRHPGVPAGLSEHGLRIAVGRSHGGGGLGAHRARGLRVSLQPRQFGAGDHHAGHRPPVCRAAGGAPAGRGGARAARGALRRAVHAAGAGRGWAGTVAVCAARAHAAGAVYHLRRLRHHVHGGERAGRQHPAGADPAALALSHPRPPAGRSGQPRDLPCPALQKNRFPCGEAVFGISRFQAGVTRVRPQPATERAGP